MENSTPSEKFSRTVAKHERPLLPRHPRVPRTFPTQKILKKQVCSRHAAPAERRQTPRPSSVDNRRFAVVFVPWPSGRQPSSDGEEAREACAYFREEKKSARKKKKKRQSHIRADSKLRAETSHSLHPDWQQAIAGYFFIFFIY